MKNCTQWFEIEELTATESIKIKDRDTFCFIISTMGIALLQMLLQLMRESRR